MKIGILIRGLILFLFLTAGLAFSAPLSPSIQVPVPDFNFGERDEGQSVTHEYQIKNTGSALLEIKDVQPG